MDVFLCANAVVELRIEIPNFNGSQVNECMK